MSTTLSTVHQIVPNVKQQECINFLNGPVMVLAGPGTGKTTTIIKRIENLLNNDIAAERILALTYSEAAASEMKVRLVNECGAKASSVVIHTYHAFCSDIISQNALKFELYEDFNVIDDLNKNRIMRAVINELRPKYLITRRNEPYFYISHLLRAVQEIKRNRITKEKYFTTLETSENWLPGLKFLLADKLEQEELEKAGKRNHLKTVTKDIEAIENTINKAREVWDIYEKYCNKLTRNAYIDFEDMINFVLEAFENDSNFLESVRSNFDYIMVDEYQDTNPSQNQLIFAMASDKPGSNIFVVGDDDQIIYSFQGAQIDNLERFLNIYPDAKVICLNENNRSTQKILDFTYNIINQDDKRLESNENYSRFNISKKLQAVNKDIKEFNNNIEMHTFAETIQENNFIIEKIQNIIKNSPETPLKEIAILTRTNSELEFFSDQFKAKNIPFQISKQKDIFSLKPSMLLYLYLKVLENHQINSMSLFGLLSHPPFSFDVEDYTFLMKEHNLTNKDFITSINSNLSKHNWKNKDRVEQFINTFNKIKDSINDEKLSNIIITILNDTGILEYYASQEINRFDNISSIKKLVDEIKAFEKSTKPATLSLLLDYLDSSIRDNINLEIDDNTYIENAVQLLTVHKSKGREFSYVFIPNLTSRNWEKRKTVEVLKIPVEKLEFSKDSEVLRLLFVGCSRAKHSLFISHSNIINGKNAELSKFILNAVEQSDCVHKLNHELTSEKYVDEVIKHFISHPIYHKTSLLENLKLRAEKHIMSPSSLNEYNTCPKRFLYSYIYRIPGLDPINNNFSLGRAVHKALEKFVKLSIKNKKYSAKEDLIKYFKIAIEKEMFLSIQDRENSLTFGTKILDNYYSKILNVQLENIVDVEVNLDLIPLEKHFIKGKIDRVERTSNNNYRVIDYKTGSAKSKKEVLEDGGSHNNYLDQLRFYKLCYEKRYHDRKAEEAELSFISEPDKSLHIPLTQSDNEIIIEKITITFEKIHNLEFDAIDPENQSKEPCKHCIYRMLCKLNTL